VSNNPTLNSLSATLLDIAQNAALQVGDLLTEAFAAGVTATEKNGFADLVTEYDGRAEQLISQYILRRHPDSAIMGEEGGVRGTGAVRWYIDPIDGTTNFATGIPYFCVSIGAEYQQQIIAGVVYDPLRREMFAASLAGAWLNGVPIHARQEPAEAQSLLLSEFPVPGVDTAEADSLLAGQMVHRFRSVRRLGAAALELAYVACGRADVALATVIKPWDVAAACLLLAQTGGRYFPLWPNGADASQSPWLAPGYVAASAGFHLEQTILSEFLR
jgi:myo-inositol-1(or 4)-monophosphatase